MHDYGNVLTYICHLLLVVITCIINILMLIHAYVIHLCKPAINIWTPNKYCNLIPRVSLLPTPKSEETLGMRLLV